MKHDMLGSIFGKDDVLPMWVADMDFRTPDFIMKAITQRAKHEALGYTFKGKSFFKSIVNWIENRHQWAIKPEWISYSPGVVPSLAMIVHAFTKPGDKILIQSPVYYPFFSTILDNGRQVINNELIYENGEYSIDFENLQKQIDSRTKMLIFCSPHNPVGRVWNKDELRNLAEICIRNNVLMVSDEIHSDLILSDHKHIPLASIDEETAQWTISTFAPSKTFNLAGLSTSYLVISNQKLKKIYDNFLFDLHLKNGNIFGDVALEAAYSFGHQWLDELMLYLESNIKLVGEFANQHGDRISLVHPEATYLLWLDFRKLNVDDYRLKELMIYKAGLGMNPGIQFGEGGSGFMRMNVACSSWVVKQALDQLGNALNSV